MQDTQPIFILGTGRCGTRSMFKMLAGAPEVEIYHEYLCTHIQRSAALYYMGRIDKDEVKRILAEIYASAVHYSDKYFWIDSSNKLSWVIEPLMELFPNAKFLVLIRNGRKVTSSFFYKLAAEIYDDRSTGILKDWLDQPSLLMPPPEKKYWWNIAQPGQYMAEVFEQFDQYERICWHWTVCNQEIIDKLAEFVPESQQKTVQLEQLTSNEEVSKEIIRYLGLKYDASYFECLQRPENVFFPMDFRLNDAQEESFMRICKSMMLTLGYDPEEEYHVRY